MNQKKGMNTKLKYFFTIVLFLSSCLQADNYSLDSISIQAQEEQLSDKTIKKTQEAAKQAKGETLGDFVEDEQFVDSASYGPAVGRPVIKGMDGYRVGIANGNIILNDLSAMSQDHAVGVMARSTQRIEVIKGPSSLLYGNYSGGVIHVLGEEHEQDLLKQGYSLDLSSHYGSNGAGYSGGSILRMSDYNVSFYLSSFYSEGTSYKDGSQKEVKDTDSLSLQSHMVLGYQLNPNNVIKFYMDTLEKEYGIANSTLKRTSIDMQQETFGLVWHNKELFEGLEHLQTELRYSDYLHSELEGGRADGLFGQKQLGISTHMDLVSKEWIFELHAQYLASQLEVCHEHGKCTSFYDARRTSIVDGVELEKNLNTLGYLFSHGHPMPNIDESTAQLGLNANTFLDDDTEFSTTLRLEHRKITPDSKNIQEVWLVTPAIDPNYYDILEDTSLSASMGVIADLSDTFSYQISLGYIERFASSSEIYWNGFHHATDSYIFGNTDLDNEESLNADITLVYQANNHTASLATFYYDFSNYIFQEPLADANGSIVYDPFHNSDVWQMKGVGARVYGVSLQESMKNKYKTHAFISTLTLEAIRGVLKDGENIPRMSPYNATLKVQHSYKKLNSTLKYKYIDKSRHEALNETATPSYDWLSLYINYADSFKYGEYEFFLKGENLTNTLAYNHLSFLKQTAPLQGRQLTFGGSLKF